MRYILDDGSFFVQDGRIWIFLQQWYLWDKQDSEIRVEILFFG